MNMVCFTLICALVFKVILIIITVNGEVKYTVSG